MKTFKLKPITECVGVFNVSAENRVAIHSSGALSTDEYSKAIAMLEIDRATMLKHEQEQAAKREAEEAREYPSGSLEAMCRAMRDAMGDYGADWQDYAEAAGRALLAMPASAIEARRAETQGGSVGDESAARQGDAKPLPRGSNDTQP